MLVKMNYIDDLFLNSIGYFSASFWFYFDPSKLETMIDSDRRLINPICSLKTEIINERKSKN